MRTARSGPLAAVAVALAAGAVSGQPRTELGRRYPTALVLSASTPRQEIPHCVAGDTARYLRARLRLLAGGGGRFYLTVRDATERPMQVLTAESFVEGGTSWTMRVPGCRLQLELALADSTPESAAVQIRVVEYLAMPDRVPNPYYSLQDDDNPQYRELFSASSGGATRVLGDAVGMVMASHGPVSWCCSGVAVGENLLLTNWHCGGSEGVSDSAVWSEDVCADTIVDLSWDGDDVSREFQCSKVLATDKDLDFALLELRPAGGQGPARPALVRADSPRAGEALRVIHHPACLSKQVTSGAGCTVAAAGWPSWVDRTPDVDLAHRCDTEEGSSGGGVFDAGGRLLALHHRGFAHTSDTQASQQRLNMAVRLDRILAHLGSCAPATPGCEADLLTWINRAPPTATAPVGGPGGP